MSDNKHIDDENIDRNASLILDIAGTVEIEYSVAEPNEPEVPKASIEVEVESEESPKFEKTKPLTQLEFQGEITKTLLLAEKLFDGDGDVPNDDSEDEGDRSRNSPNTNIGKHFAIPISDDSNLQNKTRYMCQK
ncbi:hypothetical protein ILUMI_13019, partial [Ignelater luminosus]